MFLLGDFNAPKIDWANKRTMPGASNFEKKLLETVEDCYLHQHVGEETRFSGTQSSLLDLVFTKEERDVRNIEVLAPLGLSDHGIVSGDLVAEWMPRKPQRPRRMYHKGDYLKINEELNKI